MAKQACPTIDAAVGGVRPQQWAALSRLHRDSLCHLPSETSGCPHSSRPATECEGVQEVLWVLLCANQSGFRLSLASSFAMEKGPVLSTTELICPEMRCQTSMLT